MQLNTKKSFDKAYAKLEQHDKLKVKNAITLFLQSPTHRNLRNHSVSPKYP